MDGFSPEGVSIAGMSQDAPTRFTPLAILGLVAGLAMAILFVAAAVVQHNDPDPLRWQVMYIVSALACLTYAAAVSMAFKGRPRLPRKLPMFWGGLVIAAAAIWMITLIPALRAEGWVSQTQFGTEPAREFGGLGFVVVVNAIGLCFTRMSVSRSDLPV